MRNTISHALLKTLLPALYPVATDKPLIRMGPDGDGGYLVPNDLDGIQACFSPGVSLISGFELECADKGMNVHMADASVESPADQHPRFHFRKAFIGSRTEGDFVTMDDWMADAIGDRKGDLILQMDIEGWEFKALNAISEENLNRFRIHSTGIIPRIPRWCCRTIGIGGRSLRQAASVHPTPVRAVQARSLSHENWCL